MVIVAGTEVHITNQLAVLPAHDEYHLGVRFEANQPVDNVCAGFLQDDWPARNVGRLVEARHQFNDNRDFLAGSGSGDKVIDDRRIRRPFGTSVIA